MQLQPVKGTKALYITCKDSAQKELIFPLVINYPVKVLRNAEKDHEESPLHLETVEHTKCIY